MFSSLPSYSYYNTALLKYTTLLHDCLKIFDKILYPFNVFLIKKRYKLRHLLFVVTVRIPKVAFKITLFVVEPYENVNT